MNTLEFYNRSYGSLILDLKSSIIPPKGSLVLIKDEHYMVDSITYRVLEDLTDAELVVRVWVKCQ